MKEEIVTCDKCSRQLTRVSNAPFIGTHDKNYTTITTNGPAIVGGRAVGHLCDQCLAKLKHWISAVGLE